MQNAEETQPACPICKDFGFVYPLKGDGKPDYSSSARCECKAESDRLERQKYLIKFCNLPSSSTVKTLESFDTKGNKSLEEALDAVKSIASGKEDIIFLTLLSESDRGKSHLAKAAVKAWIDRQQSAVYINVARMLDELRDGYSNKGEDSYQSRLHFYCKVGLLAMDDFGSERITHWASEPLQTIVNSRYDDKLHTILTSNRPIDDLFNYEDSPNEQWRDLANMRYDSRLKREEWCKVIVIDAPEFRTWNQPHGTPTK